MNFTAEQLERVSSALRALAGGRDEVCPDADAWLDFVAGRLPIYETQALEHHLGTCEDCIDLAALALDAVEGWILEPREARPEAMTSGVVAFPRAGSGGSLAVAAADSPGGTAWPWPRELEDGTALDVALGKGEFVVRVTCKASAVRVSGAIVRCGKRHWRVEFASGVLPLVGKLSIPLAEGPSHDEVADSGCWEVQLEEEPLGTTEH